VNDRRAEEKKVAKISSLVALTQREAVQRASGKPCRPHVSREIYLLTFVDPLGGARLAWPGSLARRFPNVLDTVLCEVYERPL
jgi:hypothetical protein